MKARVPLWNTPQKFVSVDTDATNGATLGVNLFNTDGSLVTLAQFGGGFLRPFPVSGPMSVRVQGQPASGGLALTLVNDQAAPGATKHYGTDVLGNKGWQHTTDLTIYLTDPSGAFLTDPAGNLLTDGPSDNHNALNVLQQAPGGIDGQNYHLNLTQATDVATLSTGSDSTKVWRGDKVYSDNVTQSFGSGGANLSSAGLFDAASGGFYAQRTEGAARFLANSAGSVQPQMIGAHSGGTLAAPLALANGQVVFEFYASTYDGVAWNYPAYMQFFTTETQAVGAHGVKIVFGTTSNGSAASSPRWEIAHNGHFVPTFDFTYDVGSSTMRPSTVYGRNVIIGPVAPSLGGGVGVAFHGNATTDPTTPPVGGGVMWSTGGSLRYSTPGGNVATVVSNAPSMQMVYSLADLPAAVAGVITLANNVEYRIGTALDLAGSRIVCGTNNVISGRAFSSSSLTSTGLAGGSALITSTSSLKLEDIALSAPTGTLFALNNGATGNLLITGIAILSTPTIGTVQNYGNIVIENTIVQASANWTIGGTVGSFATFRTLLGGLAGQTTLTFPSTLTITRRISILYSVVDTPATGTGINASTTMNIPDENYVLDNTVFSGAGTPIAGLDYTSNKSAFFKNVGIQNSSALCQYSMTGNATATAIAVAGTFVKVAGTTTASSFNQKFSTATTQRAAYTGAGTNLFRVAVTASMTSGNNQLLRMRIAKNGTTLTESNSLFRTTGSGEASAVPAQTFVQLVPTDYVEVFVTNDTAATNITVSDLNVTIVRQD